MLGLCRFSYPTGGDGFDGVLEDPAANRARLYDPARLSLRFWFFETLCLPTLRAQTDPDFTVVLLYGEGLPQPWKGRLLALVADVPQIRPVALPEGLPHLEACGELMRAARDPEARVVGEFSVDDDDGLALDFIATARARFEQLRPIWREDKRAALDFSGGLAVDARGDGLVLSPVQADFWAPALVVFCAPRSSRSIQNYNHKRVWSRVPSLSLPKPVMFLRGAHHANDSRVARRLGASISRSGPAPEEVLKDRFGLSAEALQLRWREFLATV